MLCFCILITILTYVNDHILFEQSMFKRRNIRVTACGKRTKRKEEEKKKKTLDLPLPDSRKRRRAEHVRVRNENANNAVKRMKRKQNVSK